MKTLTSLLVVVAFTLITAGVALADSHKVAICHIPPGNPDKAKTIMIHPDSVPDHLAHGDTLGPCE